MNILTISAITLFVFALISFLLFTYIFSIYEVTFNNVPESVKIGETISLQITPLNGLGSKVPFRNSSFVYKFIKGKDNIMIKADKSEIGKLEFSTISTGVVELLVTPKHALKPTLFEIEIK